MKSRGKQISPLLMRLFSTGIDLRSRFVGLPDIEIQVSDYRAIRRLLRSVRQGKPRSGGPAGRIDRQTARRGA